jgi:hypothetical protein
VITSRNPGDLEAFLAKIIEEIGEVLHEEREQSVLSERSPEQIPCSVTVLCA